MRTLSLLLCFALQFAFLAPEAAYGQGLAPAPPMGWNSWDSYGLTINEAQLRENAQALHDKLLPFGWRTVVLDEGWYFPNPEARPHPETLRFAMDRYGRFLPAPERFPSAHDEGAALDGPTTTYRSSAGLANVSAWLHHQGMQFGIHIIRGIPKEAVRLNTPVEGSQFHAADVADTGETCPWDPTSYGVRDNAAGQAWYDALIRQYAGWGVDFLKVDCISDHPYRKTEIEQLHRAIVKSGRPIVLSLSPGPTSIAHAAEIAPLAQMWRMSNDVWDVWQTDKSFPDSVKSQFARLAQWAAYAKPGDWPDADMLPVGELRPRPDVGPGPRTSRLTADEQQTLITLWSIGRSPLILGANLTLLDPSTLRLLTNRDVLRIDQTATASREVLHRGDMIAWTADLPNGQSAIALFNLGDTPMNLTPSLEDLPLQAQTGWRWKNAWSGRGWNAQEPLTLRPHASELFVTGN